MTFAEITKTAWPLMTKPKNIQTSSKTKNDLNKKIDPTEFKISNVVIKKNDVAVVESVNAQYEVKKINGSFYNAIIETEVEAFKKIICTEKLNVGWDRCKVYEDNNIIFRRFPLSRFLAKTLGVIKNCHEKFLKNLSFGDDYKL